MSLRRGTFVVLTLLLAFSGSQAFAQSFFGDSRFEITAGSFFQSSDTTIRIDGEERGTEIDFEDDLGFSADDSLSRFSFDWRFKERHTLSGGYYRLKRDVSKRIQKEIIFDDTVYPIDTEVSAEASLTFYEFSYTYWLMQREKSAFGITGGLVGVSIKASLTADPQAGGSTAEINSKASTDLPVILIGASYKHRFGQSIVFTADATFLPEITYDNYTGSSLNVGVGLEYEFLDHYGIGAAYNSFGVDFEADGDKAVGKFEYDIEGPQAYVKFYW